jgi:hypothetical protein
MTRTAIDISRSLRDYFAVVVSRGGSHSSDGRHPST